MPSRLIKRSGALTLDRYQDSFAQLREFDGWRCWWCPLASALIAMTIWAWPVIGGVAGFYIGGDGSSVVRVALGVIVGQALSSLARWWLPAKPWLAPLNWRFRKYEIDFDLSNSWPVLLRDADYDRAQRALRRVGLSPHSGRRTYPPDDAPQLDATFTVSPTRATPTDADLQADIARVLSGAGIEGRVGGHEFEPGLSY
jgi:hypothetical protein